MKEISRKSNKTKIKFCCRGRTAKAVHTHRFSGSKNTMCTGERVPLKRYTPTALEVPPLPKFFLIFVLIKNLLHLHDEKVT